MKKYIAVCMALLMLVLVWCGKTPVVVDEIIDDIEIEELVEETIEEWEEVVWPTEEEIADFDLDEVPFVEGSETLAAGTISSEVKWFISRITKLIEKRDEQPKDETKLTEEDIELFEKIMEEVKHLQQQ